VLVFVRQGHYAICAFLFLALLFFLLMPQGTTGPSTLLETLFASAIPGGVRLVSRTDFGMVFFLLVNYLALTPQQTRFLDGTMPPFVPFWSVIL